LSYNDSYIMKAPHERIKLKIRRLRMAKGWSQVELARQAQVTQAFISQLEAGLKKSPGVVDLLRIARALGVTVEELVGMTNTHDDSQVQSQAYKLDFRLATIFRPDKPLSVPLLRLMMAANDVRHVQKLSLLAIERIDQGTAFDRIVLNGEMLHLHRLLCGHLFEAGIAFRDIDTDHPELADSAVRGTEHESTLRHLREAYASDPPGAFHFSFLKQVRDQFGFHYKAEKIQSKLQDFVSRSDMDGTVIGAEFGGLTRYVIADHLLIGMLQDILDSELPDLHTAFEKIMGKTLSLAGDLADVVDLMLLPLLEEDSSAIIKQESGTVSVQPELLAAKQKVDKQRALSGSPENGEQKENAP